MFVKEFERTSFSVTWTLLQLASVGAGIANDSLVVDDRSESIFSKPRTEIIFLGSTWGSSSITRQQESTSRCLKIWDLVRNISLTGKQLERVRGFFNYYLCFAGNFHAVINRILCLGPKEPYADIIRFLIDRDEMFFRPPAVKQLVEIATDASLYGLGACTLPPSIPLRVQTEQSSKSILLNELDATFLGIALFKKFFDSNFFRLHLRVDNLAVVALINRGRCHWNISIRFLFNILYKIHNFKRRIDISCAYIPTAANPAEVLNRVFAQDKQYSPWVWRH
jgi:hypothetical protein